MVKIFPVRNQKTLALLGAKDIDEELTHLFENKIINIDRSVYEKNAVKRLQLTYLKYFSILVIP